MARADALGRPPSISAGVGSKVPELAFIKGWPYMDTNIIINAFEHALAKRWDLARDTLKSQESGTEWSDDAPLRCCFNKIVYW
jgi:hypothetical protein